MENDPQSIRKSYDLAGRLEKELSLLPGSSPLEILYHTALSLVWGFKDLNFDAVLPYLGTPVTEYQLTLLHIAVIEGRMDAIVKLLDFGVDINAQDFRGWTSLHHAALAGREDILRLLLERGADPSIKNVFESPYEDIIRLKQKNEWPAQELIPVYYSKEGQEERRLTGAEYLQVTGCHYIHENIFTAVRLLQVWKDGPQQVLLPGLCEIFHQKHQQFLEKRPMLRLAEVKADSQGHPLAVSPGLGVFARETYQPMDIIGEYLGLYQMNYENPSPYFVREGPESIYYGNEISRMNDSFPNATMIRLPKYRGVPFRRFLVALDRIEPGDQIVWNYGYGKMKLEPHTELRPHELHVFITNHALDDLLDDLQKIKREEDLHFHYYPQVEKLRYLLATPSVLFTLVFEGTLPEKEGKRWAEASIQFEILPKDLELWLHEVVEIAAKGHALSEKLRLHNPKAADEFSQCILSLPALTSFANALRIAIVPIESMLFELDALQLNPPVPAPREYSMAVGAIWDKWKQSIDSQIHATR